jgi:ABC-type amino acid transport substrate-binding protein
MTAVSVVAYGGFSVSAAADTLEDGEFVVGFDAEFPPYGYKDDSGEYVGFDLDLAQEVCNRRGWTLKKQPIEWNSKDMELQTGAIDCIWNGFTMNGREDKYTWSTPYVDNSGRQLGACRAYGRGRGRGKSRACRFVCRFAAGWRL